MSVSEETLLETSERRTQKPRLTVDSMTVVELVYHRRAGQGPISIESRFSRPLSTSEQPWRREKTVSETWEPLDLGWITSPGMLVIKNEAVRRSTIPTKEEEADDAQRVLLVRFHPCFDACIKIPLGESCRFQLGEAECYVRCNRGDTQVNIFCLPR